MPIFEFVCTDCGMSFEELVLSNSNIVEVKCPTCQSQNLAKRVSTFASKLSASGQSSIGRVPSSSCSNESV